MASSPKTTLPAELEARASSLLALAEARFFEYGPNPYSEGRAEDARLMRAAAEALRNG